MSRQVLLPAELAERLAEVASEEGRSFRTLIEFILRRWLREREAGKRPDEQRRD